MVHEGPAGFGRSDTPLKEGMILTNEPGLYREGEYGIRIENMVVVSHCDDTDFGTFFEFETIGTCPPIAASDGRSRLCPRGAVSWRSSQNEDGSRLNLRYLGTILS